MTVFFVTQKPDSGYDDKEGVGYEYPTSIPNGRQVSEGDYLVCMLPKNLAERNTDLGWGRILGVGVVRSISKYMKNGREHAFAEYGSYREFIRPLTFRELDLPGDPRANKQHSIARIIEEPDRLISPAIIAKLLDENRDYTLFVDEEQGITPDKPVRMTPEPLSSQSTSYSVRDFSGSDENFVRWLDACHAQGWRLVSTQFIGEGPDYIRKCILYRFRGVKDDL